MLLIALVFLGATAESADVHKCTDADGNVAYLQTPCPVEHKDAPVEEAILEESAEQESVSTPPPIVADRSFEEVEICKEPFRDEVDEIEAEMLRGYSAEQASEFKAKLRTLTQNMRACG